MYFLDSLHETFYNECMAKTKIDDCYHRALFYVLGMTDDCRNNIDLLYDWSTRCLLLPEGEQYGWITGTDMRIIRLAFNLFNNGCPTAFDEEDSKKKLSETMEYLPSSILLYMSPEMLEGCFEGIRIRNEFVK